jgi:hypothetical protein
MGREGAIDVEAQLRRLARQLIEQQRCDESGHSAAGVEHDSERLDHRRIDERHHLLDILEQDVARQHAARGGGDVRQAIADDHVADLAEPRIAAERQRARAHHFDAVVLLRVMRRGNLRAPFQAIVDDGKVEHVGAEHAVIGHLGALLTRSVNERRREPGRGDPHVARHPDVFGAEVGDEAAADQPCHFFVDLARVETSDVVGLEDLGVDAHLVGSLTRHGR